MLWLLLACGADAPTTPVLVEVRASGEVVHSETVQHDGGVRRYPFTHDGGSWSVAFAPVQRDEVTDWEVRLLRDDTVRGELRVMRPAEQHGCHMLSDLQDPSLQVVIGFGTADKTPAERCSTGD